MRTFNIVIYDNRYTPFKTSSGTNLCGPLTHPFEATIEEVEECLREPYCLERVYAMHPNHPDVRVTLTKENYKLPDEKLFPNNAKDVEDDFRVRETEIPAHLKDQPVEEKPVEEVVEPVKEEKEEPVEVVDKSSDKAPEEKKEEATPVRRGFGDKKKDK